MRGLEPGSLNGLRLRNRIIKAATYEGFTPGGVPSPALTEHHVAIARGGAAMTTVAYCAVSDSGRTFSEQLVLDRATTSLLRGLTDAVHAEGAAVSAQLGHCGGFSKHRASKGPSWNLNRYGLTSGLFLIRPMTRGDIDAVIASFATAAGHALEAGFDAIELHLGHGYLLSQFISPGENRRSDDYGGDTIRRARLAIDVVRAVREAVGPDFPVVCKTNLRDGFRGGLELEEAIRVGGLLQAEGVDALVMSGGYVSRSPFYLFRGDVPLARMIEVEKNPLQKVAIRLFAPWMLTSEPYRPLYFREDALRMREALSIPLILLGGITDGDHVEQAMTDGFEFVSMARALVADPDLPNRLSLEFRSRCNHCNACMTEMDRVGVRCILDDEGVTDGSGDLLPQNPGQHRT